MDNNFDSRITKKSGLDINDSLSCFEGHGAQQFHGAYEVFYNFIKEIEPTRIIEIGTAQGGFTTFLKIACDELGLNTRIVSYDIDRVAWFDDIVARGVELYVENVFYESYTRLDEKVIKMISEEGVTVVLCDGGLKKGEFNLMSKYLKVGDYIMAHDYAENESVFENKIYKKIWNWFEISEEDIKQACIENKLEIYQKDVFENVAWTCRKKIL